MAFQVLAVLAFCTIYASALNTAGLGSSFAAGPGLRENYAKILSAKLNATLNDLSVSGSTLLTMTSQISRLPKNADIITVTSGGNDLNYIGGLTLGVAASATLTEQQLVGRFNDDLARIHSIAPKATVYLVEYLTILGPDAKPNTVTNIESHRAVAAMLQRATAKAAEGKDWVKDVPVAKLSANHGLGSSDPWVNGNSVTGLLSGGGAPWHPNAAGMKAVADMVFDVIEKQKRP